MSDRDEVPVIAFDRTVGRHIFGQDISGYDSARLGYPPELYDRIFERAGPASELRIFEVGAGSGLATRDVVARAPAELVSIEPDGNLGKHLDQRFGSRIRIVARAFEDNQLPRAAFDVGLAAACFHWIDPEKGLSEVRRLLRPGGSWSTWWNIYRAGGVGDPFADEIIPLLATIALPPSETLNGHVGLNRLYQEGLLLESGFTEFEYHLFRRERTLDAAEMRALYASYSFIRRLAVTERERLLDQVADLVDTRFGGAAPNVVLTPLYIATSP